MRARAWMGCAISLALGSPAVAGGQAAGPADWPSKFRIGFNEFNLGFTTIVIGGDALIDYQSYNQDSASASQFDLERQGKIRDTRVLLSGRFHLSRVVTWQTGLMYDWPTYKWRVRQTGIDVAVPEIFGNIQVGRWKEGISMERVMVGFDGFAQERFTFSDASTPLLADGIKYLGYVPRAHLLWNLGAFTDWLSKGETFSYYQHQVVGRLAYVRMNSPTEGKLFHVGVGVHVGTPTNDTLQLKSKPEVFAAPNFIDTKKFPATQGTIAGPEIYYRNGSFLVGGEYYGEWVRSPQMNNPFFHGGDVTFSWNVTGETRAYLTPSGIFDGISPKRSVFNGGKGALEAVLKVSYSDLKTDSLDGGKFMRVTPMVNWHLSDQMRFEFEYGYGILDRFGKRMTTEFFQARLQLQLGRLGPGSD